MSILYEKTYILYFKYPLLQNIHISLFIIHIYSVKYSLFYNFLLFTPSPSLSLTNPQPPSPLSSKTNLQTSRSKLHQNPPDLHQKSKKNQHQINQHRSAHTKKNQRRSKCHHLHASTHTQINPQPKSTQIKQTHTNQDQTTP